ncbi:hypothetical protein AGLY_001662 [Aphis glycines]|uniref:Uncharacterized protein n=1 Tax=Aphis glycines TaxID=307491 RepID=A0A6G0U4V4_APHGL|nr:hypothetical protein AGLY_001662 [Aphis glycines]
MHYIPKVQQFQFCVSLNVSMNWPIIKLNVKNIIRKTETTNWGTTFYNGIENEVKIKNIEVNLNTLLQIQISYQRVLIASLDQLHVNIQAYHSVSNVIYKKFPFVYLLQSKPILYSKTILVLLCNLHNKVENKIYLVGNEEMHINIEQKSTSAAGLHVFEKLGNISSHNPVVIISFCSLPSFFKVLLNHIRIEAFKYFLHIFPLSNFNTIKTERNTTIQFYNSICQSICISKDIIIFENYHHLTNQIFELE